MLTTLSRLSSPFNIHFPHLLRPCPFLYMESHWWHFRSWFPKCVSAAPPQPWARINELTVQLVYCSPAAVYQPSRSSCSLYIYAYLTYCTVCIMQSPSARLDIVCHSQNNFRIFTQRGACIIVWIYIMWHVVRVNFNTIFLHFSCLPYNGCNIGIFPQMNLYSVGHFLYFPAVPKWLPWPCFFFFYYFLIQLIWRRLSGRENTQNLSRPSTYTRVLLKIGPPVSPVKIVKCTLTA